MRRPVWLPTLSLLALPLALALAPHMAAAQPLRPIGMISGANPAALEEKTVKRQKDESSATIRVTFAKPAKAPGGLWYGSRTKVAVRCTARTVAVLENRYYADAKFTKVASEKIVKIPGYAPPVPGSVPALALTTLCKAP
jgi:hypothetical protein